MLFTVFTLVYVLYFEEFAQFSVGDQLIIDIPSDNRKKETKYVMGQQQNFRDRLIRSIGTLLHNRNEAQQHIKNYMASRGTTTSASRYDVR